MNKRILIIDDDETVRNAYGMALAGQGHDLVEADNGSTGAKLAIEQDVDLVYLDLRMPDMDGVEALRHIRAVKPDLPVYIVTAFHRDFFEELVDARSEGLHFELLRKPLDRSQIIDVTTAILGHAPTPASEQNE